MQHHFAPWLCHREGGCGTVIAPSFDLSRAFLVAEYARRIGHPLTVALGEDIYEGTWGALREDVWQAIESTPDLNWLILTRWGADRIADLSPGKWLKGPAPGEGRLVGWPTNLWLGSVFSDQEGADVAYELLDFLPRRRVLFCANPTEPIELSRHFRRWRCERCGRRGTNERPRPLETMRSTDCPTGPLCGGARLRPEFDWLILSAPASASGLAVNLAAQAEAVDVPFMFANPGTGLCSPVEYKGAVRHFAGRPGEGFR